MSDFTNITVAYGDGIGPEIMEATLKILKASEAKIQIDTIEIGEKVYSKGYTTGIPNDAWASIYKNKLLLKAPITTPQGKGYKSLNVTFRKALGLFANVRPCVSYYPYVDALHQKMDMVIVRENEEDLYAGVEYQPSRDYAVSHKIISHSGSEKIIRYAFEYAKQNARKKVSCFVKDNIMKIADGIFHEEFKRIAKEYPEIEASSMIVDIGSARIASRPQDFDVVVTLNLYGDIISDIAAEVSGSVGMAGSANIGDSCAMFEAIHGSAPDIAGKGIANPSGLLNGAIMMLEHIGQGVVASKIKNAWLKTIEDGVHTGDIYKDGTSKRRVSTIEFADAVISNLGKEPAGFAVSKSKDSKPLSIKVTGSQADVKKEIIGFDVFIDLNGQSLESIATKAENIHPDLKLHLISQKGLKIWPDNTKLDFKCELVTLRYIGYQDKGIKTSMLFMVLDSLYTNGFDIAGFNSLYMYDGKSGFTLAQGE
ncbi:MAG: NADP-dependent isocitrate dehydrogenase [Alphaproteobacteria bacterium]|jgi:isocitrate dehydrogenase|nr:NADP-dependent isocitrate dehydrogenase [Candidatus Jidaibacter sp.]